MQPAGGARKLQISYFWKKGINTSKTCSVYFRLSARDQRYCRPLLPRRYSYWWHRCLLWFLWWSTSDSTRTIHATDPKPSTIYIPRYVWSWQFIFTCLISPRRETLNNRIKPVFSFPRPNDNNVYFIAGEKQ